MLRFLVPMAFAIALPACAVKGPDTAAVCPLSMDEFCEVEFGGPCPTYEEASAMFCDGAHFTTVNTGKAALVSDGNTSCDNPAVSCNPEVGVWTRLSFEADGSGLIEGITADWPEEEECSSYRLYGEIWC